MPRAKTEAPLATFAVSMVPIASVVPYVRNPRKNTAAIAKVAGSLREFGWRQPIVVDEAMTVIAGHTRLEAARVLGMTEVPVHIAVGLSAVKAKAYRLADNRTAEEAEWEDEMLALEFGDLQADGFDLALTGFDQDEWTKLLTPSGTLEGADLDEVPEAPKDPITKRGDRIVLGRHVVMCGDSTDAADVAALMGDTVAALLHADPPYGMGKEADGVLNDNLYGETLDRFQMAWWSAFRPHVASNGSAYIWGNAPDLWRLWYCGGLSASEKLELRNEIVWDKKAIPGMASPDLTQFPEASERCLFFQFGNQFLGNVNADDFPEAWEPLRAYMETEATACGLTAAALKQACGVGMFGHWFTRSQFTLIPEKHYRTLSELHPGRFSRPWPELKAEWDRGRFSRPWPELKAEWDRVKGGGRDIINGKLSEMRSYFDNAHDVMRDVWEFGRVTGEERHGHATPKPVDMMLRVMNSSLPVGGVCAEPFGGSGSTLIAAEKSGRICYTMELSPAYCDVIVARWEKATGQTAVRP